MKRLSSMALREKCTQFVFCPSLFITLAVTFPCVCPYILPLCLLSLVFSMLHCFLLTQLFSYSISPLPLSSLTFISLLSFFLLKIQLKERSFIQSIVRHKTYHITHHKLIGFVEMIMTVSPHMLTSSFFSLLFCDNADTVCNIMAHGGVKSHCAHF